MRPPPGALHRAAAAAAAVHAAPAASTSHSGLGQRYPFEEFAASRARASSPVPRRTAIPVDQRYAAAAAEARRLRAEASDKSHTSTPATEASKAPGTATAPTMVASSTALDQSSGQAKTDASFSSSQTPGSSPLAWLRDPSSHRFLRLHYPPPRVPQPLLSTSLAQDLQPGSLPAKSHSSKPATSASPLPPFDIRHSPSVTPQALLDSVNYDTDAYHTLSAYTALHDGHPDLILGAASLEALCRIASTSASRRQSAVVERILEDMQRLIQEGLSPGRADAILRLGRAILQGASRVPEADKGLEEEDVAQLDQGALDVPAAGLVDLASPHQVSRLFRCLEQASAALPSPDQATKTSAALTGIDARTSRHWLAQLCGTGDPVMLHAIGMLEAHLRTLPKQIPPFPSALEAARLIRYHVAVSRQESAAIQSSPPPLQAALEILQHAVRREPNTFGPDLMAQVELDGQLVLDYGGPSETSLRATLVSAAIRALLLRSFWDESLRMADELQAMLKEEAGLAVADAVLASLGRDAIDAAVRRHANTNFDGVIRAVNVTLHFAGPLARASGDLSCVRSFLDLAIREKREIEALRAVGALLSQSPDGEGGSLDLSTRLGVIEGIGGSHYIRLLSARREGPNLAQAVTALSGLPEASQDVVDRIIPEPLQPRAIVAFTQAGHAPLARRCWEHWVSSAVSDGISHPVVVSPACMLALVKAYARKDPAFAKEVLDALLSCIPIQEMEHFALTAVAEAHFALGHPDEALYIFSQVIHRRFAPDEADLIVLFEGIARHDLEKAAQLLVSKAGAVFKLTSKDIRRFSPSPTMYSKLIQRCVRYERDDLALKLLASARKEGMERDVGIRTLGVLLGLSSKGQTAGTQGHGPSPQSASTSVRSSKAATNLVTAKALLEAHSQGWAADPRLLHTLARRSAAGERLNARPRRAPPKEKEDESKGGAASRGSAPTTPSRSANDLDLRASVLLHTFATRHCGTLDLRTTTALLRALRRKGEWFDKNPASKYKGRANEWIKHLDDILEDIRLASGEKRAEKEDAAQVDKRFDARLDANWLVAPSILPEERHLMRTLSEASSTYAWLGDLRGAMQCLVWRGQIQRRATRSAEQQAKMEGEGENKEEQALGSSIPSRIIRHLKESSKRAGLSGENGEILQKLLKGQHEAEDRVSKTKPWW